MGLQSDGGKSKHSPVRNNNMISIRILIILTLWLRMADATDSCNWRGSGLDYELEEPNEVSRGVRPVYLRCAQGQVRWSYPQGGLRILFELRHSNVMQKPKLNAQSVSQSNSREFRVCFKVLPTFSGARMFLEGHRKLHLVHSGQDDPRPLTLKRCFVSVRGRAALYVEPLPEISDRKYTKQEAAFAYDLRPLTNEEYQDELLECRPCSDQEILENFCKSEFVIKGHVTSLRHDHAMERSELTVKIAKVLREVSNNPFSNVTTMYRPLKCGTKIGSGDFLLMGRQVLGDPELTCTPRWSDWKRIRMRALLEGTDLCLLD